MEYPQQIDTVSLLPELDELLFKLLEGLSADDWERQTIAPKWKVKDVVVHLLDGNLRTLSMLRDHYFGDNPGQINSFEELLEYLNTLNADWVKATKRLSPKVILDLLKSSGKEYCDYLATLDLNETAKFSVAWAGENESKNWFHIAREYTEKWHHQQQIRDALGGDVLLLEEKWFLPYLETSVRALPHHYRDLEAKESDLIKFIFKGRTEKSWYLHFSESWELFTSTSLQPTCTVIIQNDIAWKIFTKGIKREEAIKKSQIIGDQKLGEKVFDMVAVMA